MGKLLEPLLVLWIPEKQQAHWPCCPCPWASGLRSSCPGVWKHFWPNKHCCTLHCSSLITSILSSIRSFICYTLTYGSPLIYFPLCQCLLQQWTCINVCHRPLCAWNPAGYSTCFLCCDYWAIHSSFHPSTRVCSIHYTFFPWSAICSATNIIPGACSPKQWWHKSEVWVLPLWIPVVFAAFWEPWWQYYISWLCSVLFWHFFPFPW